MAKEDSVPNNHEKIKRNGMPECRSGEIDVVANKKEGGKEIFRNPNVDKAKDSSSCLEDAS